MTNSSISSRKLLVLLAGGIILATLLAFAWKAMTSEEAGLVRDRSASESATSSRLETRDPGDLQVSLPPTDKAPSETKRNDVQISRAPANSNWPVKSGIEDGDDYYNVKSAEEADWLNKNWYPTAEEIEYAIALGSNGELPDPLVPRSARDLVTATIVAADPSRRADALSVLHNAANQGSVYALRAIGEFHEGTGRVDVANAYFRAALFAGDWQLSLRPALGNPQLETVVTLRAMGIIDGINRRRSMRRMTPLPITVRPGYQLFLTALTSRQP